MTPHALLLLSAVLLILFAVPLWLRMVPPNHFYGVRTRATLGDEQRWYAVNASAGFDLFISGIVLLAGILVIERIGATWPPELRNLAAAALLIALLVRVSMRGLRNAR
ncbi:MAG TPA: SdpI family protein [Gemmatimonadaceae bacterium]